MPKPFIKKTKKTKLADKPPVDSDLVLPQRKVRIVSLFSGAGGLEIAACQTGMVEAIASTDSNATFLSTVEKNMPTHFPGVRHAAIVADARELKGKTMRDLLGSTPDIVMGGPPCDDYTQFGRRRGLQGEKGFLIFEFLRIVGELKPSTFVFENVTNLVKQFKTTFSHFLTKAQALGYHVSWEQLRACDHGAPTARTRVFVVGWRDPMYHLKFAFPIATHGGSSEHLLLFDSAQPLEPLVFARDVLADLPDIDSDEAHNHANHTGRQHRPETVNSFKSIKPGQRSNKSFRYRAPWDGLVQSLTAGLDNNTKSYLHPKHNREMSVREYARLHLFPDTWQFSGTPSNGLKQVANSVPIPLGKAVLSTVFSEFTEGVADR